jgi:ankyrin repeat protein
MVRRALHFPVMAAFALLALAVPNSVIAQTPPSERDLQIYAGLHAAAASGDLAEIERLIAEGEMPNIQDSSSRTPLIVAAYRGHRAAVQALIRLGANPNAFDLEHYDILTIAALNNDLELLKIALAGGANPGNVTAPYDGTALMAAAHRGHVEIVRALIEAKAPLDHVNMLGWTALIQAVVLGNGSKEHTATVEALVKAGADVTIADRHGTTALGYARQRGYSEMVRILEPAAGRRTMRPGGTTL